MPLPTLSTPTYELTIPSTGKKITFRPYTVKEQSILLMSSEASDIQDIIHATKEIVSSCIVTPGIDVDKLTSFDIEYFFINLRAKSVGEKVELSYKCNNIIDGIKCGAINVSEAQLDKVKVIWPEGSNNEIKLTDNLGIKLKYPNLSTAEDLFKGKGTTSEYTAVIDMVTNDTEYVFDSEKIYDDFTREELREFVLTLSITSMDKLIKFYSNIPYISETIPYVCKKCGYKEDLVLKGMQDFFA